MSNLVALLLGIGATLIVGGVPFLFGGQQPVGLALAGVGAIPLIVGLVLWGRGGVRCSWTERNRPDGSLYRSKVSVTVPAAGTPHLRVSVRGSTIQRADIRPVLPVGLLSTGRTVRPDGAILTVQLAAGTYVVSVWTGAPERLTVTAT